MTLDTFDAVLFTVVFLVPGFIWSAILSMLVPRKLHATQLRFLEFLTLSCINFGLWSWWMIPTFKGAFLEPQPSWAGFGLVVPMLVSPIGLGLLTGRIYQKGWGKNVFGRLGFRTVHPIPTAWDYHFSQGLPYWVIVTLQDGSRVFGLFSYRSFAGSDVTERDLYLEAVYKPTENEKWTRIEDTGGILIKADRIATIEFKQLSEVQYGN